MINTMGHLDWMATHDLKAGGSTLGYELTARKAGSQDPFWVVSAAPAVINGHNGIFQVPFLKFIAELVFAHVSKSIRRNEAK
jgi:hypothetical protein